MDTIPNRLLNKKSRKLFNEKEVLAGILAEYFKPYKYSDAINKIRGVYQLEDSLLKKNWQKIKHLIEQEQFNENEPLHFILNHANLPLDENSDREAYKWLNLLIKNIESDNVINEY
jgi:hypothetical protein